MKAHFRIFLLAALLLPFSANAQETVGLRALVLPFKEVVVSSPDTLKRIEEIMVSEGDSVTAGQTLARLDDRLEALEVERAKKILRQRQFEFQAAENLFKDNVIPEDEALKKEIERDLAQLQQEVAEEQLKRLKILSPIDGRIVEKKKDAGESVREIEEMFKIINIDKVYVRYYVPPALAVGLEEGAQARVVIPGIDQERVFNGVVDFISPDVDASSGLIRVKILMDNPDLVIKAGMQARVLPAE